MNLIQKYTNINELIPTRSQFEDIMARIYNEYKEYLREDGIKSWRQWLQEDTPYNISLSIESNSNIYDLYLRRLPEDIMAIDLINMYLNNELPTEQAQRYQFQPGVIEPYDVGERTLPWQPQPFNALSYESAQALWQTARTRITPTNRDEIAKARKNLFFSAVSDNELAEKIDIKQTELNKWIREHSGLRVSALRREEQLNRNIPEEHQWVGIRNSTIMGNYLISSDELDGFVKNINVTEKGRGFYFGSQGDLFRRYILGTFLAIDSRTKYGDLNFKIGYSGTEARPQAGGLYTNRERLITVSNINQHTIAHETGHYLDYKFARQYGIDNEPLSNRAYFSHYRKFTKHPDPQLDWAERYVAFVHNLMKKGDIHSLYTQEPSETFARFIAKFVEWTQKQAGNRFHSFYETYYNDRFSESDYTVFVRMLQEKSYLNALYPTKGID